MLPKFEPYISVFSEKRNRKPGGLTEARKAKILNALHVSSLILEKKKKELEDQVDDALTPQASPLYKAIKSVNSIINKIISELGTGSPAIDTLWWPRVPKRAVGATPTPAAVSAISARPSKALR